MKGRCLPGGEEMKDRRKGERRVEKFTAWSSWFKERRKTIIKAGRRIGVEDRRLDTRTENSNLWRNKNDRSQ